MVEFLINASYSTEGAKGVLKSEGGSNLPNVTRTTGPRERYAS